VQPGEGKPRHTGGREEETHNIRNVGRHVKGGGNAEEETEAWLWCSDGRQAAVPVAICGGLRAMPVTSGAQKTAQLTKAAETVAPSQKGWDIPTAREEMLSTSGMSAGASEDTATQEGSWQLQVREPRYSRDADGGTECRRQELQTGLSHRVRVTGPRPAEWPDELSGGSGVPPEGSWDLRPGRELRPPWTASPRRSEREATHRRSGNG
jgi:hypothetical protein